jgi:hypothetical protein
MKCVGVVAVCRVIQVLISAVCGVLYRSVRVGTGGLWSHGCGRGVCSGGSWCRFNSLTPNDPYRGRTAPLTSKVAFYIYLFNKFRY